jgi:hypothetical protein
LKSKESKEICLQQESNVRLFSKKLLEVVSIETKLIPPEVFWSLRTEKNKNLIVNHGIITHYQSLKVRSPDGIIQPIDVSPSDTFSLIKQKLELLYNLNSFNQRLVYCCKKLRD